MMMLKERFIVDENGTRIGVLLHIQDYHRVLAELEELKPSVLMMSKNFRG